MITQYNRAHFYPAIDTITVNKLTGSSSTHYLAPKKKLFFFLFMFYSFNLRCNLRICMTLFVCFWRSRRFCCCCCRVKNRAETKIECLLLNNSRMQWRNLNKKKTKHYLWRSCHGAVETLALFTSACRYYFYFYFILHNFWIRFPFNQNSSTTSRFKQFYRNEMNHFFVLHTHFFFFFVVFHISNTDNNGLNWIFAFGN